MARSRPVAAEELSLPVDGIEREVPMRTKTWLAAAAGTILAIATFAPAAAARGSGYHVVKTSSAPAFSTTTYTTPLVTTTASTVSPATISSSSLLLDTSDLPVSASSGECFAKVSEPARFETITEDVLVRPASERVEVIPARYETITENVLVTSASTKIVEVPARYEWIDEQVLKEAARKEWRKADCNAFGAVANGTGECVCLIDVPARYETVRRQVMVSPATTRTVDVPAEYKTVQKTVMASPAREHRIAVPAEYRTVTRQVQVSDGRTYWTPVGCPSPHVTRDRMNTLRLERNLRSLGYDPGLADGVFTESTRSALASYQGDHGLPIGSCDSATLRMLIP
jgi:hypothetical protein